MKTECWLVSQPPFYRTPAVSKQPQQPSLSIFRTVASVSGRPLIICYSIFPRVSTLRVFLPITTASLLGARLLRQELADGLVTLYDQNVSVHLPDQTVATVVEDRALKMLMELIDLPPAEWPRRTFTTGATANNIFGLACGRDFVLTQALRRVSGDLNAVGEVGMLQARKMAGIEQIQVLTGMPHSSVRKAASIVGLGRASIVDIARDESGLTLDMRKLENELSRARFASIVVISCGEVNTAAFATSRREEVTEIKRLCDRYNAWIHVDGSKYQCYLVMHGMHVERYGSLRDLC